MHKLMVSGRSRRRRRESSKFGDIESRRGKFLALEEKGKIVELKQKH